MRMENFTPFPNLRFYGANARGQEFGVLLVKGTYTIDADGRLRVAGTQEPLALTDGYHGALNLSSLRMPSDLVPKKPRADIIVNAIAHVPEGKAARSWLCGIRVEGRHTLEKQLRVTGPREWRPRWGVSDRVLSTLSETERRSVFAGWELSEPAEVAKIPLRYEFAYGGLQARPQEGSDEPYFVAEEHNPIGRGWIDRERTPIDEPVPAPQIEDASDPVGEPHRFHVPAGLGAIPPAWLPRRPLGGTFDQNWIDTVWPNWPADYQFAYHNSAHPDLIYPDHLTGEETVTLFGLDPHVVERRLVLPGHMVIAEVDRGEEEAPMAPMELDTLLIDIADDDPARHRVYLSWRTTFDHSVAKGVAMALVTPEDLATNAAA